jgi:hypothetical protein
MSRFRRQLPLMPEPNSPVAERVLAHCVAVCNELGTDVEVRDGVAVIRVNDRKR